MKQGAENIQLKHSDINFVEGIANRNPRIEKDFYQHCKKYFYEHYRTVFFVGEVDIEDIFQNTFIALWQNIEIGKIFVEDGNIKDRSGRILRCSLTTYLMSIARFKYREQVRKDECCKCFVNIPSDDAVNNCDSFMAEWMEEDYENAMFEIISESITHMPDSCSQILTKFYYEKKCLDDILTEIPEYNSKDALKSNKNRCLNRLRAYALKLYKSRKSK